LLNLAQFTAPTPLGFGGGLPAPPSREGYLQLLADGLNLIDAIKDLRTALHDQAKAALENGDAVPGYAWRGDERTSTIAALENLGLRRDDIIAEAMRSPKQVKLRAKARGLKVPSEFIVSTRSGTSLARVENAHAPVLGQGELARSFSEALEAFQGGGQR
jgi:hypothetical protein